jgi:hypothetical protein
MTAGRSCRSTRRSDQGGPGDEAAGLKAVGISAIFSPLDPSHERRAAELVAEIVPDAAITCSSDLGRYRLARARECRPVERSSRRSRPRDHRGVREGDPGFRHRRAAVHHPERRHGRRSGQARRLPVYSFASGATNSMRGAAYLSGLSDAMVIDVGGTTTDVGQLKHGFPREANSVVKVGGVRTLFRMPDLLSIGLGGGSHVQLDPLKVGPVSVGYRLLKDGIAFGGKQLTTTDIAVASDVLTLGDKSKVAHLDAATCRKVFAEAARMAEEAIDRMKTEAGDVPLIAVGGGAFLIPRSCRGLPGDPCRAWRLRQCRGRGDRPGLGRMRPDLQGPDARRGAVRGAGHRQRSRRGGGSGARIARHHRKRGHAARLPARQFGPRRVRVVGDVAAT